MRKIKIQKDCISKPKNKSKKLEDFITIKQPITKNLSIIFFFIKWKWWYKKSTKTIRPKKKEKKEYNRFIN